MVQCSNKFRTWQAPYRTTLQEVLPEHLQASQKGLRSVPRKSWGLSGCPRDRPRCVPDPPGSIPEPFSDHLGTLRGPFWCTFEFLGVDFEPFWGSLGAHLGPFWGPGAPRGASGEVTGAIRERGIDFGSFFTPCFNGSNETCRPLSRFLAFKKAPKYIPGCSRRGRDFQKHPKNNPAFVGAICSEPSVYRY